MKKADPFYKSKRWQALRESVLRRDGYMCRESARYGKLKSANTVHHIFPRDLFPEYQWQSWNLISLAGDVHDEMHDRQTRELTDKGKELLRRTARRRGMEIPMRYAETLTQTANCTCITLVCGLPGSGKSTWALDHLGDNGLAYDLDALAAALRLRTPHEEHHDKARQLANEMLLPIIGVAAKYSRDLIVIRSAPTLEELKTIHPNSIVICTQRHVKRNTINTGAIIARLSAIDGYAKQTGIPIEYIK